MLSSRLEQAKVRGASIAHIAHILLNSQVRGSTVISKMTTNTVTPSRVGTSRVFGCQLTTRC